MLFQHGNILIFFELELYFTKKMILDFDFLVTREREKGHFRGHSSAVPCIREAAGGGSDTLRAWVLPRSRVWVSSVHVLCDPCHCWMM